jgi:hypothetical protein
MRKIDGSLRHPLLADALQAFHQKTASSACGPSLGSSPAMRRSPARLAVEAEGVVRRLAELPPPAARHVRADAPVAPRRSKPFAPAAAPRPA